MAVTIKQRPRFARWSTTDPAFASSNCFITSQSCYSSAKLASMDRRVFHLHHMLELVGDPVINTVARLLFTSIQAIGKLRSEISLKDQIIDVDELSQ